MASKEQKTIDTLERIRPELNLEKWSIWQPAKSKSSPKEKTLKREIKLPDGSRVSAEVAVTPTLKGALTTEDQKVYYALIKIWEDSGRPTQQTFFSIRKIAKILKRKWGTNVIESITQSLFRLRGTLFLWRNSYYDSTTKETIGELNTFNILSELKIVQREVDGHITKEAGYFRFHDFILKNLLNKYTKPLFFEVIINFNSEIAQILYHHLELILADKKSYERRTKELFEDLQLQGKAYRNSFNRKRILEKALPEIKGATLTSGVITSATIEKAKDGKDYKAIFKKSLRTLHTDQLKLPLEGPESPPEPKDKIHVQADELVRYFHKKFQGVEKAYPSSKEIAQATGLIAQHGYEEARYIVDFAHQRAPETNYTPKTFGGILHYTSEALKGYEKVQTRKQAREAIKTCTFCDADGWIHFEGPRGYTWPCTHNPKEIEDRQVEVQQANQRLEDAKARFNQLLPADYQILYERTRRSLLARFSYMKEWESKALEEAIHTAMVKELENGPIH
jgi:hypothetical protein